MIEYPKGNPENPLSWEELIEGFQELTGQIMKRQQRLKIVEEIERLDGIKNMRKWSSLLLRKAECR
jgi:2-methylcitrate dehydratase PrpD